MKKLIVTVMALLMVVSFTGCKKDDKQDKQAYYATYFENHELIKEPFLITATNSTELDGYTEVGLNGKVFTCTMKYAQNYLTMYVEGSTIYMNFSIDGEGSGWIYAESENSEEMKLVTEEDLIEGLAGEKTVTGVKTVTENGQTYDVLSVIIKQEDGKELPAEFWIAKDEVRRIVYEEVSMDFDGKEVKSKMTLNVADGSGVAIPKEAKSGTKVDAEEIGWAFIAFMLSGLPSGDSGSLD